jgi:GNAT superfamily N-acetyltransferase
VENFTIRSAESRDVQRLVELLRHGALADSQEDPTDLTAYRAALTEIQAKGGSDVLVAELDGEVVGMCQIEVFRHFQRHGGLCAEVESMHVLPSFRGKAIGGRLLDAAVDAADRAGCYRVQLTSNLQRTDAHRFYERHGFAPSHVGFKRILKETDRVTRG